MLLIAGLFGGLLILISYKLYDMGYLGRGTALPVEGQAPTFSLTERSGKTLNSSDLKGKVWVADFIFTRCAGQCPMMSLKMKELSKAFPGAVFVSFTSDPEYDTAEVLSTYASWYEADTNRWFFVTGKKEALNQVAVGLKLSQMDSPDMHSNYFVLMDVKSRVRGYYDANDAEAMEKLKTSLRKLL